MTECKLILENLNKIKEYCVKNNLSFNKLMSMSKCWGKNDVMFQYYEKEQDKNDSIITLDCSKAAPIVLTMAVTSEGVIFEQTEYTQKYLL